MTPEHRADAGADRAAASLEVRDSAEFQALKRRFTTFIFPLTAAFLIWYVLLVVLAGWAPEFMAQPVLGAINVGILFGLLQFVTTFGITMWYSSWANKRYDAEATRLRDKLEAQTAPAAGGAA